MTIASVAFPASWGQDVFPTQVVPQLAAGYPIAFQWLTDAIANAFGLPAGNVQNAFWSLTVASLCSVCCSLVGCFLLLRRMSLLSDALSHSVLAGIAAVYLLTGEVQPVPMLLGALCAGIATAVATEFVHRKAAVPEDSSIGIVFTSMFAFGVIVVSQARGVHLDLDCVLFGDLAFAGIHMSPIAGTLWPESLRNLVPACLLTIAFLLVFWKELKLTSFDPTFAITIGFGATAMHYLLTTVVAVVTVAAMDVVGLLVVALLIVPPATAYLLTTSMPSLLLVSTLVSLISTWTGYLLAVRWSSSAAGLAAVVSGLLLITAVVLAPSSGVLGRFLRTVRLRTRIAAEDVLAGLFRRQEDAGDFENRVAVSPQDCREMAGRRILFRAALRWLVQKELVLQQTNGIVLTETGYQYGLSLVRSHRLWESYLQENFHLPADHLHLPAEAMEHFIGPKLQDRLTEELSEPSQDPHGREIPG